MNERFTCRRTTLAVDRWHRNRHWQRTDRECCPVVCTEQRCRASCRCTHGQRRVSWNSSRPVARSEWLEFRSECCTSCFRRTTIERSSRLDRRRQWREAQARRRTGHSRWIARVDFVAILVVVVGGRDGLLVGLVVSDLLGETVQIFVGLQVARAHLSAELVVLLENLTLKFADRLTVGAVALSGKV